MTRLHPRSLASLVLLLVMALPGIAAAIPSFQLDIEAGDMQSNFNVPRLTLTNTSSAGEELVGFSITIGNSDDYFFDFVADPSSSPMGELSHFATEAQTGATLVVGDRVNDRSGSAALEWRFDDFQVAESLVFQVDIDPFLGGKQSTDGRYALLNNGIAENSVLTVLFSDGGLSELTIEDTLDGLMPDSFRFRGEGVFSANPIVGDGGASAPVPEPTAALLFGVGVLVVAVRRPRRA